MNGPQRGFAMLMALLAGALVLAAGVLANAAFHHGRPSATDGVLVAVCSFGAVTAALDARWLWRGDSRGLPVAGALLGAALGLGAVVLLRS